MSARRISAYVAHFDKLDAREELKMARAALAPNLKNPSAYLQKLQTRAVGRRAAVKVVERDNIKAFIQSLPRGR